jgi:hypothetical protein
MAPPWSTLPFVEAHVQARSRTSSGSRRSPLRPARQQLGQTPEDQELNDHSNQSEPSPRTLPTDHRDKHVTSGLGGDRLDHPPLTHRLNNQAAPAPIGHQQAAAAPDPKALHRNLAEGTPPDNLKFPPPYRAKLWQSNDQTTRQRSGASNRSPTAASRPCRCHRTSGSRRAVVEDDKTVAGAACGGPDLRGLRRHCRTRRRISWLLGCWWPQGNHRRDQHRGDHQVGGQEHDPEPAVPGWLGQLHHYAPCCGLPAAIHRLARQSIANQRTMSSPPTRADRQSAGRMPRWDRLQGREHRSVRDHRGRKEAG